MINRKAGYTLIEMVVVITIVGIALPVIFTILYSIIQQQLRIYRMIEVKRQGDYALNYMKNEIIQDAVGIASDDQDECVDAASPIYTDDGTNFLFIRKDGSIFNFHVPQQGVLIHETTSPMQLTNNKVVISNISFSCIRKSSFGGPLVQISFIVTYNDPQAEPKDTVSFSYKTKIRLRAI